MQKVPTPELDKLEKVQHLTQNIYDFVEWLKTQDNPIYLAEYPPKPTDDPNIVWDEEEEIYFDNLQHTRKPIDELLGNFFNIDMKKVEEEKQAILKAIQDES